MTGFGHGSHAIRGGGRLPTGRTRFRNRGAAGRSLAELVRSELVTSDRPWPHPLVLGLPRGGVPVAYPVAELLQAPLDVCAVRKIGVPGHMELAMGAVGPGDVTIVNDDIVRELEISDAAFAEGRERARAEREAQLRAYRTHADAVPVEARSVIVVDDGLATGATMRAAITCLISLKAAAVAVAVPIGARSTVDALAAESGAQRVLCLCAPDNLVSVGSYYDDFDATGDDEVRDLLARAARWAAAPAG